MEVLSPADLDNIHSASLRILEQVGVQFDSPEALALLRKSGANIDDTRVRFSASLVESAVASAPGKVTLYARDPANNLYLGEGNVHFSSGFGATWVRDPDTSLVRPANIEDLRLYTRLADASSWSIWSFLRSSRKMFPPACST